MSNEVMSLQTRTVDGLTVPAPGVFDIDVSHSHVGFTVRHMMVSKVRGGFTKFSGAIEFAENALESSVEVEIEAASIDTHDERRDNHLRSADFFEVEAHPNLTFHSTGIKPTGEGEFELEGELTVRGVTRPVTLDVEQLGSVIDPYGKERIGFSAKTEIDRDDFGVNFNMALEAGGFVVGNRVTLELEVEAIRHSDEPEAE
jgi:polyisoprenoid-binding protein YceI